MDTWRHVVCAVGSLARARAFTCVCGVSLGVGMAPVVAIPYGTRIFTVPPVGVRTEDLVEIVTYSNVPRSEGTPRLLRRTTGKACPPGPGDYSETVPCAWSGEMFDCPIEMCPVCGEWVLTDQTQKECAREHHCAAWRCPLERCFTGFDFGLPKGRA